MVFGAGDDGQGADVGGEDGTQQFGHYFMSRNALLKTLIPVAVCSHISSSTYTSVFR